MVLDIKVFQENTRRASILSKHYVSFFQQSDSAQCHIFQIAYRRRNDVQHAVLLSVIFCNAPAKIMKTAGRTK